MEYDALRPRIENNLPGEKPKKDEEDKKTKKKDIWVPLPKDSDEKPREPKSLGDSLGELFGAKKAAEPEAEDVGPTVEKTDEDTVLDAEQPQFDANNELVYDAGELPIREPMAQEWEVPLRAVQPNVVRDVPPAEYAKADEPEDSNEQHKDTPQFFAEQPAPLDSEKVTDEPPVAAESGGGGSHEPPPQSPEGPTAPESEPWRNPEQPPEAVVVARDHLHPELVQQAQATNPNAEYSPPADANRANIPPHSHVENNGAVLGLAVFESWRHHRMNKRTKKIEAKQNKRMKQIERAQAEARDQQYRAGVEQVQKDQRLHHELEARPTAAVLVAEQRRDHHPSFENQRPRSAEQLPRAAAEKVTAQPERIIEDEPVALPPEHHIVRSEWHNIEVDKSGHAVEAPVLEYGGEFKREQHQEARRQDELAAASVAGASIINTTVGSSPQPASSAIDGSTPPDSQHLNVSSKGKPQHAAHDTTTLWLVIVLIIIILAIISTLILR